MFFDDAFGLVRAAVISVLAYAALIGVLRVAGKRSLAKLNAFDWVVTVALGSTLATVLLSKQIPLLEGILAFGMLVGLQWIVARLSVASPWFSKAIRNEPRLLVQSGNYRAEAMAAERVTRAEVDSAIRGAGIGRLENVAAVVLETDGSMSVIPQAEAPVSLLGNVRH